MCRTRTRLAAWLVVAAPLWGAPAPAPAAPEPWPPPAETGACGADTRGGLDGRVIRVTTLDASGPGSLRAALEASGPRLVVFEVGGVIDMQRRNLHVKEPFVTVAGQTAPDPGITIVRGSLVVDGHDVVLQHLAVRPGDAGQPRKSGWSPDGISMAGVARVLVDHCSTTWAVDENLTASGPRYDGAAATSHDVTIRHCLIAEALDNASHEKGAHSKGTLVHDFCRNIAVIGNLYAHNADRNPYFKAATTGAVVNNVIYDPGGAVVRVAFPAGEWKKRTLPPEGRVSVVGNVYIAGADTRRGLPLVAGTGEVFAADNQATGADGQPLPVLDPRIQVLPERPVWPQGCVATPVDQVLEQVLRTVGARPWQRDEIDRRIVESVRTRTGRIIDSQEEVGGYPLRASTTRPLQIPATGLAEWLATFTPAAPAP